MTEGWNKALREPRTIGVASAVAATLLGLFYLAAAGAPARYLVVNLAALALGLVALGGVDKAPLRGRRSSGRAVVLLGTSLLASALFGASVDGASRWIWIGPLSVQVSLVLLPFMIVSFARHRNSLGTTGIAIAALALALQPDRAMAGVLALSLAALAASRRDVFSVTALLAALPAFAVTLLRSDTLPAVPFVDRILFSAFSVHPLAGAAILLGAFILVLPAIAGRLRDPADGGACLVFGAIWIGCVAAAALGNYPTPVVGYGGSAILGYVLSLSVFPPRLRARRPSAALRSGDEGEGSDRRMKRSCPPEGVRRLARSLSMVAFGLAAAISAPADAQSGHISRMTPGYTYFNRAGASLPAHDADLRDCATIASRMNAEERVRSGGPQAGLAGGVIEGWIAAAAQRGIVASAIENCMVVRGWRVVSLDEGLGRRWEALPPRELRATLSEQIGAPTPTGRVVRWWNNDAARASSKRFELRPPASGKQLGLRALLDGGSSPPAAPAPSARTVLQSWKEMKRTVAREHWSSVSGDRALVIVKMKGVGPKNGVTLSFQRVGEGSSGSAEPIFTLFQHGLSGNRQEGRFYVFDVEPGTWRLATIHALHLCLGAPAFEVGAGEVVYGGSFDLGSEAIGPDLGLTEAQAFLAGHPISARLRPARYRNGFTETCSGVGSIYALEVPGAPFEPSYRGGSRAGEQAR